MEQVNWIGTRRGIPPTDRITKSFGWREWAASERKQVKDFYHRHIGLCCNEVWGSSCIGIAIPVGWNANTGITDRMFLIHIALQSQHTTIEQYCNMLAKHYILPHFIAGALELHLLFDDQGRFSTSPKAVERQRRYQNTNADHAHYNFREQLPNT